MTPHEPSAAAPAGGSAVNAAAQAAAPPSSAGKPPILPMVLDIGLNVVIPTICYRLAKQYVSPSEFAALLFASLYPILKSISDVIRRRELDPVSVVVLLGIGSGIAALLFNGSYRILLLRESLFTFVFGLACLGSLLLRSPPLMFYFGRVFATGNDPVRRAAFDASWEYPAARRSHRVVTLVWGLLFIVEFGFRAVLIYTVSPATVLAVSPVVLGTATILVIVWTFRYGARAKRRALERKHAQSPPPR